MTDLILERRGTIDKYMGDCIMAFWNAPLDDDDHARHASGSALAMIRGVRGLNEELKAEAEAEGRRYVPINIGIGLNSGECCVGNMGSEQRFDYSVLGDDVNLAARLEGQSKTYGVDIVIGEKTYGRASEYAALELDLIKVKGKEEAVRIYALLGEPEMRESRDFKDLEKIHGDMLTAYRGREWRKARTLVAECRRLNGGLSGLYDLYEERLDAYEETPPPPDWDGVFVATTK
ncbi:MAG: adenylate/guanylate cyclase domain-containing protein, partial [Alphaproteobacteria bacterium]